MSYVRFRIIILISSISLMTEVDDKELNNKEIKDSITIIITITTTNIDCFKK
jgi:hypothetical protein